MSNEIPSGSLKDVSWGKEGAYLFSDEKRCSFTRLEKQTLKVLIYKGTPAFYRKKLWMIGSGAQRAMKNNPKYYKNLLEYSLKVFSTSKVQIDLDLKRTYPENPLCSNEVFYNKLQNVLLCYSIRNSSIGYCQGMNFIEEAFWLFVQIVEYLLPLNYYSELAGVITETTMISFFLQKFLPSIHGYFVNNHFELTVNNFIHKWLVSLFTQNFDANITMVIWDYFFLEGNIILTKTCLGVFALLKNDILIQNDFEEIYNVLNDKTNEIKKPVKLIYFLAVRAYEYDTSKLNDFRTVLQIPIIENLNSEKNKRINQPKSNGNHLYSLSKNNKKEEKECDTKWPCCLYDESYHDILNVLILKYPKKINVISDYYYSKATSYPIQDGNIDEFNADRDTDILCERKKHNCIDKKIIENSRVFLEQSRARSNSFDSFNLFQQSTSTDLYEIINKGTNFENAKERILTEFSPEPITNQELIHLYQSY